MASITARRAVLRGRPPNLGGGRRGAITAHSRSVISLGYGQTCACGRGEWSRPRPSDPPPPYQTGESQSIDATQFLFGPALTSTLANFSMTELIWLVVKKASWGGSA